MKKHLPCQQSTRALAFIVIGFVLANPAFAQSTTNLAAVIVAPSASTGFAKTYQTTARTNDAQLPLDNELLPNIPQPCTVMFHGITPLTESIPGTHSLDVRVYNSPSSATDQGLSAPVLLHEESLVATVARGAYDITLKDVPPGIKSRGQKIILGVSIDGKAETLWPVKLHHATEFTNTSEPVYIAYLDDERMRASAVTADVGTEQNHAATTVVPAMAVQQVDPMTGNVKIKTLADYSGEDYKTPMSVRVEYGIAGPMGLQYNPMSAMQFGRGAIDVMNVTSIFGAHLGVAARMMRSGTDFRYYAGGVVADVNNDGSVLATIGVAEYQTGTDLNEPYTISPFSRLQYFTSPRGFFLYGEVEATVHLKGYLSGTAGVGVRFLGIELIAGYHYSMYVLPDIATTQTVNGFNSIASINF